MRWVYLGPRRRLTALAAVAGLVASSAALAGPFQALKVENMMRYIQVSVHMLAPADGIAHPVNLPGTFWGTPYTWAGAGAAAVNGSSQHLVAPHAGEAVPGPLHTYGLVAVPTPPPAIPPRTTAFARLWHGGAAPPDDNHPDIFVEVLAANMNAAVFADIGVHDPPPGSCSGLYGTPSGKEVVPLTPSDALAASAVSYVALDRTLCVGLVVQGISAGDITSSGIHAGPEGSNGPMIVDLGGGADWQDLDGIAVARILEDYVLPEEYVDDLLNDETYIQVCTAAYPGGEIRGQILLLPWDEEFDYYDLDTSLHGRGGWKGWDNDPNATAYVTDVQSHSAPHSVNVEGAADLVHEFEGSNSGKWQFAAWTYIPSDFESGGSGQFAGSYFVLLNTYVDGGPPEESDYSVQMNFDSNDGMLKIYYGDGYNTVDVPYVPDEWVEINIKIDLDIDSCTVSYDDEFVAEYSWTGGVYGGGGGALDIAALDLYAQDSTSIYYDDLLLRRWPGLGDLNCDGSTNGLDIDPFVLALTDPAGYLADYPDCDWYRADCNEDGSINGLDIDPFVDILTGG